MSEPLRGVLVVGQSGGPTPVINASQMVSAEIERAAQESDVVIMAQASMARLAPKLEGKVTVPLLSSLSTAVEELARALKE